MAKHFRLYRKGMRNRQVWTVIEDNTKNIWVGTKEFGLYRYNGKEFIELRRNNIPRVKNPLIVFLK